MAGWMQWQIFTPILLLQFLNIFWYFLIWRILFRCVFLLVFRSMELTSLGSAVAGSEINDERSDDEGSDDEDSAKKEKKKRS